MSSQRALLLLSAIAFAAVGALPSWSEDLKARQPTLSNGLVGHWTFDGHTRDASGCGHHGSAWSNFAADRLGEAKQSLQTSGRSGFVTIADHKNLDTVKAFTVSVWVNPRNYLDARGEMGFVVSKWHSGSTPRLSSDNGQYYMAIDANGKLYCLWADYDSKMHFNKPMDWMTSETAIPKNRWTHVAVTFEHGRVTLYVGDRRDKSKMSYHTSLTSSEFPHDDLLVGGLVNGRYNFDGAIDDLRIYNRALSDKEIGELSRTP